MNSNKIILFFKSALKNFGAIPFLFALIKFSFSFPAMSILVDKSLSIFKASFSFFLKTRKTSEDLPLLILSPRIKLFFLQNSFNLSEKVLSIKSLKGIQEIRKKNFISH